MDRLKKGDIVARLSYNKDILFVITRFVRLKNEEYICILKGITERIEADSPINDLVRIDKRYVDIKIKNSENRLNGYIEQCILLNEKNSENSIWKRKTNVRGVTGKILHLDGDKRYADKSAKYYKNLGLNAIVKNIDESKQPYVVKKLLERYRPDIVIVTRT